MQPISVEGLDSYSVKQLSNDENKNIILIYFERSIIPSILIVLVAYIVIGTAIEKKRLVSLIFDLKSNILLQFIQLE